jgi:hypothetical protein
MEPYARNANEVSKSRRPDEEKAEGLKMSEPRNVEADALFKLILLGLTTDGSHHKQWVLEKILDALVEEDSFNDAFNHFQWDRGIAP